jgi:hypothetical protein
MLPSIGQVGRWDPICFVGDKPFDWLIPYATCTMFIVHTMNLIHFFTYLYILQV